MPPRLVIGLNPAGGVLLGYGRYDRAVEAAREQHPIWHIGHQLAMYGLLQGFTQQYDVCCSTSDTASYATQSRLLPL